MVYLVDQVENSDLGEPEKFVYFFFYLFSAVVSVGLIKDTVILSI